MARTALNFYNKVAISHLGEPEASNGRFTFFPDPDIFFKNRIVKCVYIATPVASHSNFISKSVQYNLPCLVEKPILLDIDEAQHIANNVNDIVAVAFKKRYSPLANEIKKMHQRSRSAPCQIHYTYLAPHPGKSHWKIDPKISGGGVLMDLGSHVLDLLEYCISPIFTVTLSEYHTVNGTDAYVAAKLNFSDGSVGEIRLGWASETSLQKITYLQGTSEIAWQKSDHRDHATAIRIEGQSVKSFASNRETEYLGLFDAYRSWVDGLPSDIPRWQDGMRNLKIIKTIEEMGRKGHQSAEVGRP